MNSWKTADSCCDNIANITLNLSVWNKEVFRNMFNRKQRIIRRLEGINRMPMTNSVDRLINLRNQLWQEYNSIVKYEEAYWFQKAKSKWINLGDLNNSFFHLSSIQIRRTNKIIALQNSDLEWIYENSDQKEIVLNFYKNRYAFAGIVDYSFHTVNSFPAIKEEDLALLNSEISLEETKKALFSMNNYKSTGPDGFHSLFFKSQWEIIGSSLHRFVTDCFLHPDRIGEVNQTLIALIFKCDVPNNMTQFRPISLCNAAYNVVTKIITQRLRSILPYIVSANQNSFVPGRSTYDNILVLQETIILLITCIVTRVL